MWPPLRPRWLRTALPHSPSPLATACCPGHFNTTCTRPGTHPRACDLLTLPVWLPGLGTLATPSPDSDDVGFHPDCCSDLLSSACSCPPRPLLPDPPPKTLSSIDCITCECGVGPGCDQRLASSKKSLGILETIIPESVSELGLLQTELYSGSDAAWRYCPRGVKLAGALPTVPGASPATGPGRVSTKDHNKGSLTRALTQQKLLLMVLGTEVRNPGVGGAAFPLRVRGRVLPVSASSRWLPAILACLASRGITLKSLPRVLVSESRFPRLHKETVRVALTTSQGLHRTCKNPISRQGSIPKS